MGISSASSRRRSRLVPTDALQASAFGGIWQRSTRWPMVFLSSLHAREARC
jgi:hypothetical protein